MTLKLVSDNPRPQRGPRAPATLGSVGKETWKRVIAQFLANGVDIESKRDLIQQYAEAVEGAHDCALILKKEGRVISQRGKPAKAHPTVRSHLHYQQQTLRLAEKLGIVAGATSKDRKLKNDPSTSVFD